MLFARLIAILSSALISSAALAKDDSLSNPMSRAGTWTGDAKQKTCAALAWRVLPTGEKVLNVWNTDGSVFQSGTGVSNALGAVTPVQALMTAVCSPRLKLRNGHKYWVRVDNPGLALPHPVYIGVPYPPENPPAFLAIGVSWINTDIKTKTCAMIQWTSDKPDTLLVVNTDNSALAVLGIGPRGASPEQLTIIDACGPVASVAANRSYRASVDNPRNIVPHATHILFAIPNE